MKFFEIINLNSDWVKVVLWTIGLFAILFISDYVPENNLIVENISKALQYLFASYVILKIYNHTKDKAETLGLNSVLAQGFLWCAGIAIIFAVSLGSPSCVDFEQDNRGGACLEYADDGYTPSSQARYAEFAFYLTIFYIPVIIGARKGNQNKML